MNTPWRSYEVKGNSIPRRRNTMESTEPVVTSNKESDQVTEEMPWWPTFQSSRKSRWTAIWSILFSVFSYEAMSTHSRKFCIFKHFWILLDKVILAAVNRSPIQSRKKKIGTHWLTLLRSLVCKLVQVKLDLGAQMMCSYFVSVSLSLLGLYLRLFVDEASSSHAIDRFFLNHRRERF